MRAKLGGVLAVAVVAAGLGVSGCGGTSSGATLSKTGQPVHLVIGYQPYYTEAWSALVLRQKQLWKQYLPKGSTVDFQVGLQGSLIVAQMLAGKEDIGYTGDMPSIVGVSKRSIRDLRIVATVGVSPDQCGIFLVRKSAPTFSSEAQAIKWMNGKTVATPQGSCTDRVTQAAFQQEGVKPKAYLNQSLDLVTSDFRSGTIDAAAAWEPTASKLVDDGMARRVASGDSLGLTDAAFMLMSKQLLQQRPDVATDWLKAELAAERYLANPGNATAIAQMAVSQTTGYTTQDMRNALYRGWPVSQGGAASGVKLELPFIVNAPTAALIKSATAFLSKIHAIATPQLPPGAVDDTLSRSVLKASGEKAGAGAIRSQTGSG
jgi:NitT/TauT family transport system substrate-binding protein